MSLPSADLLMGAVPDWQKLDIHKSEHHSTKAKRQSDGQPNPKAVHTSSLDRRPARSAHDRDRDVLTHGVVRLRPNRADHSTDHADALSLRQARPTLERLQE